MSPEILVYACPRCNRGGFRSLAGPDGKAHCPWCGDRVGNGAAAPAPQPTPSPVVPAPAGLDDAIDRVARDSPEIAIRALRDRLAEADRKRELAEAELRREFDKRQDIKRAVMTEMSQLHSQLGDTTVKHKKADDELRAAQAESARYKGELDREKKRSGELARTGASLDEQDQKIRALTADLEAARKTGRELEAARDTTQRDLKQARSDLGKLMQSSSADLAGLQKKLDASEAKVRMLKESGEELKSFKTRLEDYRRTMDKERVELQEKATTLTGELEKRDQRIKELQLLIKTLGERLNDLTSRHFGG